MMSAQVAVPNFGFGSGSPLAAVPGYTLPIITPPQRWETTDDTVINLNNFLSYFVALAAIDFVGTDAVQRTIYNKYVKDFQKEAGVPLPVRIMNSLLFTTPVFVTYQSVSSNNAKRRRIEMCDPSLDPGEGIENHRMYYYDKFKDTCTKFHYKGSKGNDNKFATKDRCELVCRPFTEEGQAALQRKITSGRKSDIYIYLAGEVLDPIGTAIYAILLAKEIQMDMPSPF